MNKQITTNTLFENFRQQGVMRERASFFGKTLGASAAEKMQDAFVAADLMLPELNFFGTPYGQFSKRPSTKQFTAGMARAFTLPNRPRVEVPRAA